MDTQLLKQLYAILLVCLFLPENAYSQSETRYICQFSPPCENLSMDTTLEGNIWQLGSSSDKPGFDHLSPYEHCLMTDSLKSYPVNNHSAFILKYEISELDEWTSLQFGHFFNTDSSKDGGYLEVSYDEGMSWTNIVYDSVYLHDMIGGFYSKSDTLFNGEPGFSGMGESLEYNGQYLWQMSSYAWIWPYLDPKPEHGIYLKFNFLSDSIEDFKPGWIIGAISLMGAGEGINNSNIRKVHLYPNPTQNFIFFQNEDLHEYLSVEVFDVNGRKLMLEKHNLYMPNSLDVSSLSEGIYLLQIKTKKSIYSSKFMKY